MDQDRATQGLAATVAIIAGLAGFMFGNIFGNRGRSRVADALSRCRRSNEKYFIRMHGRRIQRAKRVY